MFLKALKPFSSPVFGNVVPGQKIEISEGLAKQFASVGYVELPESKTLTVDPVGPNAILEGEPVKQMVKKINKKSKGKKDV